MNARDDDDPIDQSGDEPSGGSGFLGRWSARKRRAEVESLATAAPDAVPVTVVVVPGTDAGSDSPSDTEPTSAQMTRVGAKGDVDVDVDADVDADGRAGRDEDEGAEVRVLTDVDMPPIESLDAGSDMSGFFSRGVSATLRRAALRHVFALPMYNVRDGLNDYDGDYTVFEPLGNTITSDMKFHTARLERKRLEEGRLEQERLASEQGRLEEDGPEEDQRDEDRPAERRSEEERSEGERSEEEQSEGERSGEERSEEERTEGERCAEERREEVPLAQERLERGRFEAQSLEARLRAVQSLEVEQLESTENDGRSVRKPSLAVDRPGLESFECPSSRPDVSGEAPSADGASEQVRRDGASNSDADGRVVDTGNESRPSERETSAHG